MAEKILKNKTSLLRKNITISSDDFQIASMFAKKSGLSFSELVRKATMKYVEEQENLDLARFLRENCPSVPEDEEYEIIEVLNNRDKQDEGEEINLEKFIQNYL